MAVLGLIGLLAWRALGNLIVSASERFFLLVPLLFLAQAAWRGRRRSDGFLKRLRPAAAGLAVLTVACAIYNLVLTGCWHGVRLGEVALSAWFVSAVVLIGVQLRRVCRPAMGGLLGESFALCLFVPFLLATFHVHRFKVPNVITPAEFAGRPYEEVAFSTSDGLTLRGWFVPAQSPSRRTLLVCHGMGTNRSAVLPLLPLGDAMAANLLFFDFRGHGESDGHTVSFGQREQEDVLAAVGYLRTVRANEAEEIVGIGTSMGAAALVNAAARLDAPFSALILDSGFAVAGDLTDSLMNWVPDWMRPTMALPVLWCASMDADCWVPSIRPVDRVSAVRAPVLVIHAQHDSLVPLDHARQLYAAARDPKAIWIAETGDHSSIWQANTEYARQVLHLLNPSGVPAKSLQETHGVKR